MGSLFIFLQQRHEAVSRTCVSVFSYERGCHNSCFGRACKPQSWKQEVISQLKQHGIANNVINCVLKKLGLQDTVLPVELSSFRRYKRALYKPSPLPISDHCQGKWFPVCLHVMTCQRELKTQYSVHQSRG